MSEAMPHTHPHEPTPSPVAGLAEVATVLDLWSELLTSPDPHFATLSVSTDPAGLAAAAAEVLMFFLDVAAEDGEQALEMLDGLRDYLADAPAAVAEADRAYLAALEHVRCHDGRFAVPDDLVRASVAELGLLDVAWAVMRPLHVAAAIVPAPVGDRLRDVNFLRAHFLDAAPPGPTTEASPIVEANEALAQVWAAAVRRDRQYLDLLVALTPRHLLVQAALRHLRALLEHDDPTPRGAVFGLCWVGEQLEDSAARIYDLAPSEAAEATLRLGRILARSAAAPDGRVPVPISAVLSSLDHLDDAAVAAAVVMPLQVLSALRHNGDEAAALTGFGTAGAAR